MFFIPFLHFIRNTQSVNYSETFDIIREVYYKPFLSITQPYENLTHSTNSHYNILHFVKEEKVDYEFLLSKKR